MRKQIVLMVGVIIGLVASDRLFAQQVPSAVLPRCRVEVSDRKTSNILFPYAIKSVDRGNNSVMAQVVHGFPNILQLKAADSAFQETNLTVITTDGKFYSFLVNYAKDPRALNLSFGEDMAFTDGYNEEVLERDAAGILQAESFLQKSVTDQDMRLGLRGIYLKDNLMWFKLRLTNYSQVAFQLDNLSLSAVDKKQSKRTARQEIQMEPVYSEVVEAIQGKHYKDLILAFKPFTLSGTKQLKVLISDKTGGRNLNLIIPSRKLLRAKALE